MISISIILINIISMLEGGMCNEIKSRTVNVMNREVAVPNRVVRVAALRKCGLSKGLETCADMWARSCQAERTTSAKTGPKARVYQAC